MKTVLLKVNCARALSPDGGVTLAHPDATRGPIDESGPRYIVAITEVPDVVADLAVAVAYAATADMSRNLSGTQRYTFRLDELGPGRIVR